MKIIHSFLLISLLLSFVLTAYPVVILHGIGDSCNGGYMRYFPQKLNQTLGVYGECIESGGGVEDFSTPIIEQSKKACEAIKANPNFQGNFSIVALSQGGLIARYIIEECEMKGTVKRLVTIGTPHMGVSKIPNCMSGVVCYLLKKMVSMIIYTSAVQNHIGPAGYFVDNLHFDTYKKYSNFLPELNNENKIDEKYIQKFTQLEKVLLMKFTKDTMIYPKESAWFEFVDEKDIVVLLKNSTFYNKDQIGLKKLMEEGKVQFVEVDGNHLQFSDDDEDNYIIPTLA